MRTLLRGLAAVLALSASVQAGPLEKNQVSADARWVVHIDVDAFRAADDVRKIAEGWLDRDPAKKHLAFLRQQIGLDPAKDLHSITFYGSRIELGRGVVAIRAAFDRKRLLGYLEKQPGYKTGSHGDYRLHLFQTPGDKGEQPNVACCLQGSAVIVFSNNTGEVTAALDVLDGKKPGLGGDSPLVADIPAGTILWLGATGLAEAKTPFKSPFFRLSEQLLLALGERDREVFLDAKLVTKSKEDAAGVRPIIESFRVVAIQRFSNREDVKTLLRTLEVSTNAETVNVRWHANGQDVAKFMQSLRRPSPDRADHHQRQEEQKKKFLEKYDKNRNGKIDDDEKEAIRAEWTKAMKERRAEHHKKLLEKYDVNKDGELDDDEKNAMRTEWTRRMEELKKRKQAP